MRLEREGGSLWLSLTGREKVISVAVSPYMGRGEQDRRARVGVGRLAGLLLDYLLLTIQHHLVEGEGQRFATGVGTGLIGARLDSQLREL